DTLSAADARMLGLVTEIVVGDVEEAALGRARQLAKKPVAALLQTRDLLKGDTGALCDRIDQEISLFQQALQDDTTLRRLQRIARLAA
ncbi:MAG: crotonase, partial [Mesorhizobium sp.]